MSTMIRWEPLREPLTLRDAFDRMFNEALVPPRWFLPYREELAGTLPLDVIEHDNELVVKASVPGFKPEEIDISIVGEMLTIKGEVKEEQKKEGESYILQERRIGMVQRVLRLPMPVQAEKANAVFEEGILTLTLPKAEEVKPKQIKIKMNGKKV